MGILLSVLLFITELLIGPGRFPAKSVIEALMGIQNDAYKVVWEIRLPRAIGAVLTGITLGLSGLLLQVSLKNPLAEPYLIGVSGGASLGVMATLAFFPSIGFAWIGIMGFMGALFSIGLVIIIGELTEYNVYSVILAGVAISAMTASLSIIIYLTLLSVHRYSMLWLYGTLSLIGWSDLKALTFSAILLVLFSLYYSKTINTLLLGDEQAASLGVNPASTRRAIIIVSTATVALLTSYTGPIGFIGLMSPHLARMMVGAEIRRLTIATIPVSVSLTLVSDALSRIVVPSGGEAPLGAMTALLGVPFFLYLLVKRR